MTVKPRVVVTRRLPEPVEREIARDFDATLNTEDRPLGPDGLAAGAPVRRRAALHGDRPADRRGAERGAPAGAPAGQLRRGLQPHRRRGGEAPRARRQQHARCPHRRDGGHRHDAAAHRDPPRGRGRAAGARGRVDRLASDPHARHPGERQDPRPRGDGPDRARGGQAGASGLRHEGHLPRPLSAAARRGPLARRGAAGSPRAGAGGVGLRLPPLSGDAGDPAPDERGPARRG